MKKTLLYIVIFLPIIGFAQIGGNHTYQFLTIPTSARSAALGGSAMGISDSDITLANENPALLTTATSGKVAFEYLRYYAGINLLHASYARNFNNIGTFGIGIQHFGSGEITRADEFGAKMGTFKVSETAFKFSYNRSYDSIFNIGATFKPIISNYDIYKSFGIAMDVGASFKSKNELFSASLLFKNMGTQITKYNDVYEPLPFEISAGMAYKLAHAPFRLSMVAQHLENPKMTYENNNQVEPQESSDSDQNSPTVMGSIVRHFILGVEFTPTKNFFVRGGYNIQRREELKLNDRAGAAGFSWGFGFRIKKLHFSYANSRYHFSSASNHITVTTNLSEYRKKRN